MQSHADTLVCAPIPPGNAIFWTSFCILGQPLCILLYAHGEGGAATDTAQHPCFQSAISYESCPLIYRSRVIQARKQPHTLITSHTEFLKREAALGNSLGLPGYYP